MKIFETFKCSGQNLWNFFCQFWNDTSIPLQILYLFSGSWKIIPLYFFSSKNIYFPQKEPIKRNIFFNFRVHRSNFVKILLSILKWGVDSSPNFVSLFHFHERLRRCTFLGQTIYTLLISSRFKWKSWGRSSAQIKICQIPYANFEVRSRFLSKFCIPLPVSWKITPLYFFSSSNIYFAQKESIKIKIFQMFEWLGQNFSNFFCQFWNNTSIPLQILYPSSF